MAAPRSGELWGRANEVEALDRLLEDVRSGRSTAVVIRGEAGVGKTALLRHCMQEGSGFRVAQIAGVESEMELPFAGLHQLCGPMLAYLRGLPQAQRDAMHVALGLSSGEAPDRFLVALAALNLLAEVAAERPVLCVVEDAQWLDQATGQVLGFVARRLSAESVAMVFAVREPWDDRPLAGLPHLRLGGLPDDDARALLATVVPGRLDDQVRDRIVAETGGNPLALLELPRGMSAAELAGGFAVPHRGGVSQQIEESYRRRVVTLPEATQRLLLLAAADPVGDAALVWRAARTLGIGQDAAGPAADEQLVEIGARVRFRHPLVRSAVYGASSTADRRIAHGALADVTDPDLDPDRRAWHRAHAAVAPDDHVARELLQSASRAQARGGAAAAAAFLERAAAFTSDPVEQAHRGVVAAEATFAAGDLAAAEALLAAAAAGPLDIRGQAQVERVRARITFDLRRGRDAPLLLLRAAQRLEPVDADLAGDTYLEALLAAVYAARLATGSDVADVALAARSASRGPERPRARQLLVAGLATRLTEGYVAAAPTLRDALRASRTEEREPDWLSVSYTIVAQDLWDDQAWFELASRQTELARASGALSVLRFGLDYLAGYLVQAGDLSAAAGLLAESEGLDPGIRAETLPYIPLLLAAWRGQASPASTLIAEMEHDAVARGEGCAITVAEYATAILFNGTGHYERALDAAQKAAATDEIATSSWALSEAVEAAARSGQREVARGIVERLAERTQASGTEWGLGTEARSRALVEDGVAAEELHVEAVERLARCRMRAHLARARLTYGEWLRRQGRRVDAREQLRVAHEEFATMGADGFAERARGELLATGERVRKRNEHTPNELTPQEERIARLARDGRTNPEIGAELFLSARTVQWHLGKVFAKLGITSRRGLRDALPPGRPG